jgi:hypothetical protein
MQALSSPFDALALETASHAEVELALTDNQLEIATARANRNSLTKAVFLLLSACRM